MATPAAQRHGLANKHLQRQCPANRHDRARPKPPRVASPMRLHSGPMICEQRGCTYMPCLMMRDQQGCTHMPHDSALRAQSYVTNQVARNLPRPWGGMGSGTKLSQRPTATLATSLLPRHAARRLRTWPTDALAQRLHATCHHDAWPTANTSNTVECSTPRSGVQRGQLLRDQHGCTYKPRS